MGLVSVVGVTTKLLEVTAKNLLGLICLQGLDRVGYRSFKFPRLGGFNVRGCILFRARSMVVAEGSKDHVLDLADGRRRSCEVAIESGKQGSDSSLVSLGRFCLAQVVTQSMPFVEFVPFEAAGLQERNPQSGSVPFCLRRNLSFALLESTTPYLNCLSPSSEINWEPEEKLTQEHDQYLSDHSDPFEAENYRKLTYQPLKLLDMGLWDLSDVMLSSLLALACTA